LLDQKAPKVKIGKVNLLQTEEEWHFQEIKRRYYQFAFSQLNHHADCAIYRSLEQHEHSFCSCGLLHDLEKIGSSFIEIVYPRYWHDYYLQESGEDTDNETSEMKEAKQKERAECQRTLYEIFGPPDRTSLSEIKEKHNKDRELLTKVFGRKFIIEGAGQRLNKRMQEDIENYRLHERHKVSGLPS
jgi:hypothetical protein